MTKQQINLWFIGSILLNACGNSFLIIAGLGSSPWTAAGQNLAEVLPLSIGICTILLQIFSLVLALALGSRFSIKVIVQSLALALIFGLLIDLFTNLLQYLFIPQSLALRLLYMLIGMNAIAAAIAIYVQANRILLPFDYLLQSFAKRAGSYTAGTILCLSIPLIISLIFSYVNQRLTAIGLGTLLFILFNGFLIDRYALRIRLERQQKG